MRERLSAIQHIVLDMDGTIYLDERLFPETLPFLATLFERGVTFDFITNNNSLSRDDYVVRLNRFGISASKDKILVSTDAAVRTLRDAFPDAQGLFVLGTDGLRADLCAAGFEMADGSEPDAVVVGFDSTLCYEKLCRTAYWITRGKPYIATHPDRVCPTDEATVLPDCGAICALLKSATGRDPDFVPGKPNPAMLHTVLKNHALKPHQVAMVGDRLYTDIRMARDAGVLAVLTLTGETSREEASQADTAPDIIIENLGELGRLLTAASRS